MAKLILSMDGLVLKEINLTKERTTIGRKPHNDVQIDNLAVSGEHAVIVTILEDSFLEDLGSTNGTVVNGQPIKKHFLQNNDVIELGKYKLKYVAEASAGQAQAADFEKTMVLRPGAAKAMGVAQASPAAAAPAASSAKPFGDTAAMPGTAAQGPASRPGPADPTEGRRAPAPVRPQCRQGARPDQAADDARQAGRPGGGHYAPPAGLFHHSRGGGELSGREWQASRRSGALTERSRRHRLGRRQDGILLQDVGHRCRMTAKVPGFGGA